jgi:cardiolipin synthase A/B
MVQMTTVRVLVPVLKGKIHFVVDKGRHWSLVEHLILEALASAGWTADDLSQAAAIPKRVVVEALVRLMRAGWVELGIESGRVRFRATSIGARVATFAELPRIPDLRKRPTNYILDTISGEIFRNREVLSQGEEDAKKASAGVASVWIEPSSWQTPVDINHALTVLLDNDETFVSGQPGGLYRRWLSVLVRGGLIISGLPEGRALPALRRAILDAVESAGGATDARVEAKVLRDEDLEGGNTPNPVPSVFHVNDLVLGGDRHREVLDWILGEAQTQIFIHSTFIDLHRVEALLEKIAAAIERGVKVQIFWGQNEDHEGRSSTREAISDLRKNLTVQRFADNLIFHPNSTGSHAKLIVADAGIGGEYVAVVGSCNWLTSSFNSYEVSVVLREAAVVRSVVGCFAKLVCMHDGLWSELASELALVCQLLDRSKKVFAKRDAQVSVVVGAQHNDYVLRARDEAARRIVLASHRLGTASRPGVITPLGRAAKELKTTVEVFYCRRTSPIRKADERQLSAEAASAGIGLEPVLSPRLHAKFLIWDDDDLLITSLNWLSADQTDTRSLGEIGVHVRAPGVARALYENFAAERESTV